MTRDRVLFSQRNLHCVQANSVSWLSDTAIQQDRHATKETLKASFGVESQLDSNSDRRGGRENCTF